MFGLIKSIGSKAISSLPVFNNLRIKILTPSDPNLQQKLQQISTQILKAQQSEQFKIYQQLQSVQGANFNRQLRKIYEHQQCTTQSINAIIRFYTFLLTNCKNQLVICKLVSQPLVIQLTKIVLHIEEQNQNEKGKVQKNGRQENSISLKQYKRKDEYPQQQKQTILQTDPMNIIAFKNSNKDLQQQQQIHSQSQKKSQRNLATTITPLHYTTTIDWDEVNAYKVALIRSYINCINSETINYMIIDNELPIFINCINGYKHYLTEGVEGTCISNCILMILTKVDHNDEVCGIMFDERHNAKYRSVEEQQILQKQKQMMGKSICIERKIKLHQFIQEVIVKIGQQLGLILQSLQSSSQSPLKSSQLSPSSPEPQFFPQSFYSTKQLIQPLQKSKQVHEQFIQSNMLFCMDLINSISNYNYTSRIKSAIGEVIQKQLINRVIRFVQLENDNNQTVMRINNDNNDSTNTNSSSRYRLNLVVLKTIKHLLNLSITCQKQHLLVKFLNKHIGGILNNVIDINYRLFASGDNSSSDNNGDKQQQQQTMETINKKQQKSTTTTKTITINSDDIKNTLTYTCNVFLILLKQITSSQSKLSSRTTTNKYLPYQSSKIKTKRDQQLQTLKSTILEKIFLVIEQFTQYKELKQNLCFKIVRNMLLGVFYLTLKEDKCSVGLGQGGRGLGLKNKKRSSSNSNSSGSNKVIGVEVQGGQSPKKVTVFEGKQQNQLIVSSLSPNSNNNNNNKTSIQQSPSKKALIPPKQPPPNPTPSFNTLALSFNYSILLFHKTFTQQFKDILKQNSNWQFIVNNYQSLMRQVPTHILSPQQSDKYCHYHNNNNYQLQDQLRDHILVYQAIRNYRYMIIHETNLQQRYIRLENIYHKHFLSPGWGYEPGEIVGFNNNLQYKIVCTGMLHNNNLMKLPIQILHDAECLLITHKLSDNQFKIIANIRYKKIASFIPQGKSLIRMKLIGIQELILEFGSLKMMQIFKEYLNENRNKTREKELKFINYYLNLYLKDTEEMIESIYQGEIVDIEEGDEERYIEEGDKKEGQGQVNDIDNNNIIQQQQQLNSVKEQNHIIEATDKTINTNIINYLQKQQPSQKQQQQKTTTNYQLQQQQ